MRFFLRPGALGILASYLLFSLVPFAPLLFGQTVAHPLRIVAIEAAAWLSLWVVFKRPAWFHWLIIPAFIGLPVEIYLHAFFGQGITPHHLGIIVETSPREAMEFLGNKVWLLGGVVIGLVLWWYGTWRAARNTRELDLPWKPRLILAVLLLGGLALWQYGEQAGVLPRPKASASASASGASTSAASSASSSASEEAEESDEEEGEEEEASDKDETPWNTLFKGMPKLPWWMGIDLGKDQIAETRPFGLGVVAYGFWKERSYLAELREKSRQFKFGAYQESNRDVPQVVVLVIGESSRFDRWSINGYKRETNPLLKQETNLVTFSNVVAAVSATRLSVPVLLTRKPATQSLKAGFEEKSLLSTFREAGFKTYWLSNQMSYGEFDTPISVFANEADVTQFLNLGGFTDGSNHDQILLDPLKNALADPAPKKLIVLHTLGNHWNYSHRHPKEFDKWQPSLMGVPSPDWSDPKLREALSNSYDNSILYVDWFLSKVIGMLKTEAPKLSSMFYVSDHGEAIYDGNCNLAFHGHNTVWDFHVPALAWYSASYRATYPDKVKQMQHHRNVRLSTENVFHSVVDMADVRYPTESLERSLFSRRFKHHTRYVDSYGWTNFDHATLKGECREVIDKGKPLVQEK